MNSGLGKGLRVALVHDWLTGLRGGEKVLEELCQLFPEAVLHTLIHIPGSTSPIIERMTIRQSWIQHLPFAERHFRAYLPLFPAAIESFDLRGFDLVISTSHCVAKGVIPDPDAVHLAYVFTPMRYAWDLAHEYFHPNRVSRLTRALGPLITNWLRVWDVTSSARVDRFVACSHHVARRIRRYYARDASVVHAPVDVDAFTPGAGDREHLLITSALVPYKAIDLAISAVRGLDIDLLVVGNGPERERLQRSAPSNVRFLGSVSHDVLLDLYRRAVAFLLPGEEDFGIAAIEAQACGVPVVAYGRGGALETVKDGLTGCLFPEPNVESLRAAIATVRAMSPDVARVREHALGFSRASFVAAITTEIEASLSGRKR